MAKTQQLGHKFKLTKW